MSTQHAPKHSPAPWSVANDGWNTEVYAADGFQIVDAGQGPHLHQSYGAEDEHWATKPGAHIERDEAEEKANALLISAAPDLLAALKAMADYYGHQLAASDFPTEAANMQAAIAAIAKAEGQS